MEGIHVCDGWVGGSSCRDATSLCGLVHMAGWEVARAERSFHYSEPTGPTLASSPPAEAVASAILQVAQEQEEYCRVGMVVVGGHKGSGLWDKLKGSVSQALTSNSPYPRASGCGLHAIFRPAGEGGSLQGACSRTFSCAQVPSPPVRQTTPWPPFHFHSDCGQGLAAGAWASGGAHCRRRGHAAVEGKASFHVGRPLRYVGKL